MTNKNAKIIFSYLIFSCLFILLIGLCTGCGANQFIKADLGQEFSLGIGQTARIESEQLTIRFNGIDGDSRCPTGVTCVWAGEVSCKVTVTYQGSSSNMTLSQIGPPLPPAEETYGNYRLLFSVQPYPSTGTQISDAEYRLIMTVEKL
jgi:hypothetical protein